ncbi:hypothetical protein [Acinetobacter pittii]|uniref:hypothetical protein n=1 Tax=Acinetobacter pittii TaxID=48296 RepID=UPI0005C8FB64|nr:hypothetical protein [Acinetobacter pittii]
MTDLNKKQAFWAEQLPLFKEKYWLPEHLDVLEFNMDGGCFEIPVDVKTDLSEDDLFEIYHRVNSGWAMWKKAVTFMKEKAKAQAVPVWISAEVGSPIKFGTRVKIKRKSWDEEDNLIYVESEATYDKDSDFCELSNRTHEYETWFDHELNRYLDEDELTHWAPMDKSESGAEG